ncbi:MAG: anaerobic sulfatase maturase [Clostridia bacterium]|nr:anaerobic sulfatase maturase [Clostridia bacterium]
MPPLTLMIKPSSSLCNMRCRYCFYADTARHRSVPSFGLMTAETLEVLVRRVFEYADRSVNLIFQGGEPTLAGPDLYRLLFALEERYNTKGLPVSHSLQTNGYAVNDEWAAFLAEHRFLVGLSMDGCREIHDAMRPDAEGHGTYDRVSAAARVLGKHHVDFNVLCVVTDAVAKHPIKVYESLKKYGYVQFIPCLDPVGAEGGHFLSEDAYAYFLRQTFDLWYRDLMRGQYVSVRNFDNYVRILQGFPPESCAMTGCCTVCGTVESDGSVYPCDFYASDEWRLGDLRESSLAELLTSEKAKAFVSSSRYVSEECAACRYLRLCRGGCRREREPFENGHPALNRHCAAFREFFDHDIDRLLAVARGEVGRRRHS